MTVNDNEKSIINKFFQVFATYSLEVVKKILDNEVYKKLAFNVVSSSEVENIEELKNNNVFYRIKYSAGLNENVLGILIPEEFLCLTTDVLMGGKGTEKYEGSLTELEINSARTMLQKIFKEIEEAFAHMYNTTVAFNAEPNFIVKESEDYDEAFKSKGFNYAVQEVFTINDEVDFKITILTNIKKLKAILNSMNLLDSKIIRVFEGQKIGIENLADLKINITAELGHTRIPFSSALALANGSFVKLETLDGEDISVFANDVEVAKAQVVVIENNFGLKITKIINPEERMKYI